MKIVDERETPKTNKDRKDQRRTVAIGKGWKLNDFVVNLS